MWHRCSWCTTQQCEVLKTPTPHKPYFVAFQHLHVIVTAITFVSQDFGIRNSSFGSQLSALCFKHRLSGILLVQCHRLAHYDGSTRRGKSLCVSIHHFYAAHLKHSVVLRLQKTCTFHRFVSPSTHTKFMNQRDLLMRSGQATPISHGRECLKKNNE